VVATIHVGTNPGGIARHGGKLTWISQARRSEIVTSKEEPSIGIEASTRKPYYRWLDKRIGTEPITEPGKAPESEPETGKMDPKLLDEFE
jgi:hypothetical protein